MAITTYISLISLTYCLLILLMCQINFSFTIGLHQNKNHPIPLQQQDDRLPFVNEYYRQHFPVII